MGQWEVAEETGVLGAVLEKLRVAARRVGRDIVRCWVGVACLGSLDLKVRVCWYVVCSEDS